uniref:Uncharacterized protein n=1 Tax=Sinocyclocheilus grahami TaxID=75366 RepID=A0A672T863_SINGR
MDLLSNFSMILTTLLTALKFDGYSSVRNGGGPGYYNPDIPKNGQPMEDVKLQAFYNWYGLRDVAGPIRPLSSKTVIYSAGVKGGYGTGSYSSQTGWSGGPVASGSSGSDTRSQLQDSQLASAGSGSVAHGSVGNAVGMGMSGYGLSQSVGIQGSDTIHSFLVLTPLQQSTDSVKPVQLTSQITLKTSRDSQAMTDTQQLVQTISQSSGPQPAQASTGTMAQSSSVPLTQISGQQLAQASSLSAWQSRRKPLTPLRDPFWRPGSKLFSGFRPVQNPSFGFFVPLPTRNESVSQPSYQIVQHSSELSSPPVAQTNDALVSQSFGQQLAQSSGQQPPSGQIQVRYVSVAQPSSQQLVQGSGQSVAQASSQQLVQASQSVSQSSGQQPAGASYISVAQPSSLTLFKPKKGSLQYGSKLFSGTRPLQKPNYISIVQSSSLPAQSSYPSESQASVQQPAQASYQSASFQQPAQASYQSVAQLAVQQPAQANYQSVYQTVRPLVAQVGSRQSPGASYSVAQPSSLQGAQSCYQSVVQHGTQMDFKPVQAQGGHIYQIGSKLYSCQEYNGYPRPSRLVSSFLAQHIKPVVQHGYRVPVKPGQGTHVSVVPPSRHPGPLQSTLLSAFRPAQLLEQPSYQPPVLPSRPPLAKPALPSYGSVSQPSGPKSGTLRLLQQPGYQPLAKPGQDVHRPPFKPAPSSYQPQMLPSRQSLSQSGYSSPAIPVQSSFEPQTSYALAVKLPNCIQIMFPIPGAAQVVSFSNSVSESVQPGIRYLAPLNYLPVTNQNAPGPAQSSQCSYQTSFRLLK